MYNKEGSQTSQAEGNSEDSLLKQQRQKHFKVVQSLLQGNKSFKGEKEEGVEVLCLEW